MQLTAKFSHRKMSEFRQNATPIGILKKNITLNLCRRFIMIWQPTIYQYIIFTPDPTLK